MPKWIQSFEVPSTGGHGRYIVSLDKHGTWGCSCPNWKFRRAVCKHILAIREQVQQTVPKYERVIPICRAANVPEVRREQDDVLLVPLLPLNDEHFLATVIVDLLMHGLPFPVIRQRYHLPASVNQHQYLTLVKHQGRRIYSDASRSSSQRICIISQSWNLPEPFLPGESPQHYSERTGCPEDIAELAFSHLATSPLAFSHAVNIAMPTAPTQRLGKRRILASD